MKYLVQGCKKVIDENFRRGGRIASARLFQEDADMIGILEKAGSSINEEDANLVLNKIDKIYKGTSFIKKYFTQDCLIRLENNYNKLRASVEMMLERLKRIGEIHSWDYMDYQEVIYDKERFGVYYT